MNREVVHSGCRLRTQGKDTAEDMKLAGVESGCCYPVSCSSVGSGGKIMPSG